MPDIDIQCLSCGNEISVSDIVDISKLKCRACGGEFLRSDGAAAPIGPSPEQKRRSLMKKVQRTEPREPAPKQEQPKDETHNLAWEKLNNPEGQKEVQKESSKLYSALTWKAWVLFLVIAAISGGLRYSGIIPSYILAQAVLYEALIVVVIQVFILLKAFQDSVFQGVMCVLLPPYAFYYLFAESDDFNLRAVTAGLLVGLGQDAGLIFFEWSQTIIQSVNDWIASGG